MVHRALYLWQASFASEDKSLIVGYSVEDVDRIAIRNLADLAGEGIGEGYGSRQQQECA